MTTKCFILMPFAKIFEDVHKNVFKIVCEQNNIECWRVDEKFSLAPITREIVKGILDADILIADLTDKYANVFYEVGIAHSISNKTILISQEKEKDKLAFDLAFYRIIFYENTYSGLLKLREDLDIAIKTILANKQDNSHTVSELVESYRPTPPKFEGGITGLLKDFHDFSHKNFLEESEDLIIVLNDGRSWIDTYRERLAWRVKTNLSTKIILIHPKSEFIMTLTKKNGKSIQTQKEEIQRSFNVVNELKEQGGNINIYGHYLFNPYSLFLNEKQAVIMPYYFTEAGELPVLIFDNQGSGSLYETYKNDTKKLLENSAPLKIADFYG